MAFIPDLIDANLSKKAASAQQKEQENQFHAQALTSMLKDPEAGPDAHGYAMHTLLTKHGGLNDEQSGHVLNLVKHMTGGADTVSGNDFPQAPQPPPDMSSTGPIQYEPAPPPKTHPVHDFLLRTLAGALSGGETEKTINASDKLRLENQLAQQRQQAEAISQSKIRQQEQIAQEGRAPANAVAMQNALGPIEEARARRAAVQAAQLTRPTTPPMMYDRDTGEPVPAQYVLDVSDEKNPKWNLQPLHITGANGSSGVEDINNPQGNLTVAPKSPSKIISDAKSGPYAIERPNGKRLAPDDPSLTPAEKQDFSMAKAAHEKGVEDEATLGFKNDIAAHLAANPGMSQEQARREVAQQYEKDKETKRGQKSDAQIMAEQRSQDQQNEAENRIREGSRKQLESIRKDVQTHHDALEQASTLLDSGTSLSLSLLAPSLLKALVGGAGSGVRITQAEIGQVMHSTTTPQILEVQIRKWLDDPAKYKGVPPITVDQARQLVKVAYDKIKAKLGILEEGDNKLNQATGTKALPYNTSVINTRKKLNDLDAGKVPAQPQDRPSPPRPGASLDADNAKRYMNLAGQDKKKAFAMATEDGWKP